MKYSLSIRSIGYRLFFLLLAITLMWLGTSAWVTHKLTRRAQAPFAELLPVSEKNRIEVLRLTTSDGESIGAWYVPGHPERATLLLLHGNGGNRSGWLPLARELAREGLSLLMITFRAHGDSSGLLNDIGYGGRLDVLAAVTFLEKRRPGQPIVLLGFSLGAAAALFAADRLDQRVRAYILESPYPNLMTALNNRLLLYLPAPLDRLAYWGMSMMMPLFLPHWRLIVPEQAIHNVPKNIPILLLAGEQDRRATLANVDRLYSPVKNHAKQLRFPGAKHGQVYESDPVRYQNSILEWIKQAEKDLWNPKK